jgi:hypothetical protein
MRQLSILDRRQEPSSNLTTSAQGIHKPYLSLVRTKAPKRRGIILISDMDTHDVSIFRGSAVLPCDRRSARDKASPRLPYDSGEDPTTHCKSGPPAFGWVSPRSRDNVGPIRPEAPSGKCDTKQSPSMMPESPRPKRLLRIANGTASSPHPCPTQDSRNEKYQTGGTGDQGLHLQDDDVAVTLRAIPVTPLALCDP